MILRRAAVVQRGQRKPLLPGSRPGGAGHDANRSHAHGPGHGPRMGARHVGSAVRHARPPEEILLGKTIPYFVLGMIGLALCLLVAKFLFHIPFRGSVGLLGAAARFICWWPWRLAC